MEGILFRQYRINVRIATALLCLCISVTAAPDRALAQQPPEPLVAVHVSELTQALETMPASPPTPMGTGTSGNEWWYTSWHYFTAYESLKEALRSDGTPYVEVSDADIAAGALLHPDGSPRYPILISLASEAIADNELAPLRDYVDAGGFLFVGSSAFTRYPDGSSRENFALATEMGLRMDNPSLSNWYENNYFKNITTHRLTSHIPRNKELLWGAPLAADEIPWGVTPTHMLHGRNYVWQVTRVNATILAWGFDSPILMVKSYGEGQIIYHGAFQPLIGHGGFDPSTYAYLIYRNAIDWAFESFSLPLVRVSPWPYQYDAAFVVRHDFENDWDNILSIASSAQAEHALGVKGDYYFSTGTVRQSMSGSNRTNAIAGLQNAVANYGATIGSHNGGLKNPVMSLPTASYDYWHWGPDEALDVAGKGKDYAYNSILYSFEDIEGWLTGLDNGRPGCGATGTCPRIWASPYFNSTREDSKDILEQLGAVTMSEQKIGPFPHRTLSYETAGKRFSPITLPVSEWFICTSGTGSCKIAQGIDTASDSDYHTTASLQDAVDFYYDLGGLINIYGHSPTTTGSLEEEYIKYGMSKARLWSTNAVGVNDWWRLRSSVAAGPAYTVSGDSYDVTASVSGATDPETTVEIAFPLANPDPNDIDVLLNGELADPADYRVKGNALKIRVGVSPAIVKVQHPRDTSAPDAPAVSAAALTNNAIPTWSWTPGGGGNGTYRYKLDDSDLATGATTTTGASYTPGSALADGSHTLYVQERDAIRHWSASGSFAVVIDTTAPTLAISAPSQPATHSGNGPVAFTVTYLGADAVTLTAGDITLNATNTASGVITVSGDGAALRTVTISDITGYGTLGITIAAGTASDLAGNSAGGTEPSATFGVTNSSGDFDGNGVNVTDALKALRIAAGLDKPTTTDLLFGDVAPWVDGKLLPDGKIDISDVVVVLRKAVGLTTW